MPQISGSCQYDTLDGVMQAFQNRQVPSFAIFCGKQFLFKYEADADDMTGAVAALEQCLRGYGYTSARYTLCVYETVPATGIKSNTEHDGSFNFQLQQNSVGSILPRLYSDYGGNPSLILEENKTLKQENAELRAEIKELEESVEAEDEQDAITRVVGQIERVANNPVLGPLLQGFANNLAGFFSDMKTQNAPVAVNGMPANSHIEVSLKRLQTVPDFPLILSKLADLWEKNPGKFDNYMTLFKGMKI